MKTPKSTILKVVTVAILGTATACSDAMGPEAPPPPPPEPQFEFRYDVTLTVRYLRVSGFEACDGRSFITNNPLNGEFQYRLEAEDPRSFRNTQSTDYGSVLGKSYSKGPGETINFANKSWTFNDLENGELLALRIFGTEWDGPSKDRAMNNLRRVKEWTINDNTTVGRVGDLEITTGVDSDCQLTLVYDWESTRREVRVN